MARTNNLENFLTDVADSIRVKKEYESSQKIAAEDFDTEIYGISTSGDTTDATATANDIINPKTAYINGSKVTGAIVPTYEPSTTTERTLLTTTNSIKKVYKKTSTVLYLSSDNKTINIAKIINGSIDTENAFQITNIELDFQDTVTFSYYDMSDVANQDGTYNLVLYSSDKKLVLTSIDLENKTIGTITKKSETTVIGLAINPVYKDIFACFVSPLTVGNMSCHIKIYSFSTGALVNDYTYSWSNGSERFEGHNVTLKWDVYSGLYLNACGYSQYHIIGGSTYTNYKSILIKYNDSFFTSSSSVLSLTSNCGCTFLPNNKILFNNNIYLLESNTATLIASSVGLNPGWSNSSGYVNNQIYVGGNSLNVYNFDNSLNSLSLDETIVSNSSSIVVGNNDTNNVYAFKTNNFIYFFYVPLTNIITKLNRLNTDFVDTSSANATAGDILVGKTAYVGGNKVTGVMPNNGALNYTPSTTQQTIPAGYTSGGSVSGDANLLPENIKAGVTIFGVTGTYTGDVVEE